MDSNNWPTAANQRSAEQAPRFSLAELTERAEVTVRTVRYYIAEGLLPPPLTAGRQSAYAEGHLDRLRLIAQLKDAYLPLREIRRRLAGLDDAAVRALLDQGQSDEATRPGTDSARSYLDRVLDAPSPDGALRANRLPSEEQHHSLREGSAEPEIHAAVAAYEPSEPAPGPLTIGAATTLSPGPVISERDWEAAAPEAWRRVRLTDDAELLVRESAYRQRQDRIDWLIRWARRVFR